MDYSKMKATKVSRNAGGSSRSSSKIISEKNINKSKRSLKKIGISWIVVAITLVIGLLAGFGITKLITRNDTYEMITYASGNADVYIGQDEEIKTYTELGIKCIAFGKDVSDKFKVTYYYRTDLTEKEIQVDRVDETKEGIYYAIYTSPSKKYSTVKLIRNIIVLKGEDNG